MAGFAVERALGERTWEAMQPELGRRVILRLVTTPFTAADWPDHPGVVDLLTVTEAPAGTYVATQFVPGARTLAERRAGARAAEIQRWLDAAAATLADVTHGDLTEHDILISGDGRVLLTGFGRRGTRDDAAALERMRAGGRAWSRWWLLAPAAVVAAGAAAVLAGGGGDDARPAGAAPPPVLAGASALGSRLDAGEIVTVDCTGAEPSGSSLPCTLMQADLPGRLLAAPSDGVVRAWAVRGVRGRVRLQVLRAEGDQYLAVASAGPIRVDDPDRVRRVRAQVEVQEGARFALEVDPGTGIGMRRGVAGARTRSFTGPVRDTPRDPDRTVGTGQELQLRVEFVPDG